MERQNAALECLEQLFQNEIAGINRYLHYSFMIMGYHRIPIQKWFRDQAMESMAHSIEIGEKITALGGHPTLSQVKVEESNKHEVDQILRECLMHEEHQLETFKRLAKLAGDDMALEEMARGFVRTETAHIEEVRKMLKISSK